MAFIIIKDPEATWSLVIEQLSQRNHIPIPSILLSCELRKRKIDRKKRKERKNKERMNEERKENKERKKERMCRGVYSLVIFTPSIAGIVEFRSLDIPSI